jgi:DNA-directed RNA polymerase subunit RPC12/RpoP
MEVIHYKDVHGKTRKGTMAACKTCGKEFVSRISQPKIYCSTECFHKQSRRRLEYNCAFCGKQNEIAESKSKRSKSGLRFCDRKCKEQAQRLTEFAAIRPSHYGTGTGGNYREFFETEELYCRRCGYKEFPHAVQIHHVDHDRSNNKKSNLMPLCACCHVALHGGCWNLGDLAHSVEHLICNQKAVGA